MARALYPTLEAIEDAVVAALAADPIVAAYARDVRSFQGTLEQALEERSFLDPAFLVIVNGGEFEPMGHLQHEVQIELGVMVRSTNLRGDKYQRAPSSASEIGTYQMVQDALRVLTLEDLGLDGLSELQPQGWELLQSGAIPNRTLSAQIIGFSTTAELREAAPDDALETVEATYETPDGDGAFSTVAEETIDVTI